ncbi:hypothetical protein [Massilia sp. GCM10023247]|uniref:hypothetical protein n=1 Tax=Massilia sp. GCM10023247 TaxID=3252643 RepID=UPI003607B97A
MSYDLMVFSLDNVPTGRSEFLEWFDAQTEGGEDHSYNDPGVTAQPLRDLFNDLISTFPPMNGPYAVGDLPEDTASLADYNIGKNFIYIAFSWDKADEAYAKLHDLSAKHKVGFFDVSSDTGAVWMPGSDGELKLAHEEQL